MITYFKSTIAFTGVLSNDASVAAITTFTESDMKPSSAAEFLDVIEAVIFSIVDAVSVVQAKLLAVVFDSVICFSSATIFSFKVVIVFVFSLLFLLAWLSLQKYAPVPAPSISKVTTGQSIFLLLLTLTIGFTSACCSVLFVLLLSIRSPLCFYVITILEYKCILTA